MPNDVTVTFDAVIGRRTNNCVELFVPDEYKKYNGDGKRAIPSRFIFNAPVIKEGERVAVTGKMTFVRDSTDTYETCDIITGRLFDIIAIE